jgi:hypothetical protein
MSKLTDSFARMGVAALLSCGCLMLGCQADTVPVSSGSVTPIPAAGTSAAKPTPAPSEDAGPDDEREDDDDEAERDRDSCDPDCDARECGSDGCGGSCGRCGRGRVCDLRRGVCQAPPECDDADAGTSGDCAMMSTPPPPAPEPAPRPTGATPSLERCMGFLGTDASDACKECVCGECAELAVACYDSGDPSFDAACGGLAECGNRNGCYDYSCYCGTSALCLAANGPCRAETELAASSIDVIEVLNCYDTRGCASNRARTLGECLVRNCDAVCGP